MRMRVYTRVSKQQTWKNVTKTPNESKCISLWWAYPMYMKELYIIYPRNCVYKLSEANRPTNSSFKFMCIPAGTRWNQNSPSYYIDNCSSTLLETFILSPNGINAPTTQNQEKKEHLNPQTGYYIPTQICQNIKVHYGIFDLWTT